MANAFCERIDKILASLGLLSRREATKAARSGRISVNGSVEKDASRKITNNDILCLDGETINYSRYMYLLLNKPMGYVCAAEDGRYPTVFELLPKRFENLGLFTVGRLDMNTTGVLLITNDGALSHALLSPKNKIIKQYFVETKFPVSDEDIRNAANGLALDGDEFAMPAIIECISQHESFISVYEGKFHLVKRIFLSLHNQVRKLERVKFANITCDGLDIGEYRHLSETEIDSLYDAVGGKM